MAPTSPASNRSSGTSVSRTTRSCSFSMSTSLPREDGQSPILLLLHKPYLALFNDAEAIAVDQLSPWSKLDLAIDVNRSAADDILRLPAGGRDSSRFYRLCQRDMVAAKS